MRSEEIRPTLLVVEDDDTNRQTLERVFSKEPYELRLAADGETALDIVREESVDVVLSDLMMPGMDGLELLKTVRTLQPDIEFILVTAYGTVEKAVEAMKEGAYDFITKPFKRVEDQASAASWKTSAENCSRSVWLESTGKQPSRARVAFVLFSIWLNKWPHQVQR